MSEHLRDRLHEEMSGQLPPPDHDLVAGAVSSGLRTRRVRRTASGAGTVAVVSLTVLAVTFGSQVGAGPRARRVGRGGAGATTARAAGAAPAATTTVAASTTTSAAAPTSAADTGTVDAKVAMAQ